MRTRYAGRIARDSPGVTIVTGSSSVRVPLRIAVANVTVDTRAQSFP
jgi:hypothetical protein